MIDAVPAHQGARSPSLWASIIHPSTFSSNTQPSRWNGSRTSVGAIGVYEGSTSSDSTRIRYAGGYPLVAASAGGVVLGVADEGVAALERAEDVAPIIERDREL